MPQVLADGGRVDAGTGMKDGGTSDASTVVDEPEPDNPDNPTLDSDCDGLNDAEEYGVVWPSGSRTNPGNPDSDGDGIPDGREAGRTSSVDPRCAGLFVADGDPGRTTDPTDADSDEDGLPDGQEDANHDGIYGRGTETDPRNPDSDGDGLCDGPLAVTGVCTAGDPSPIPNGADQDADGLPDALDAAPTDPDADDDGLCDGPASVDGTCVAGEDLNADGYMDDAETDPYSPDTDCDGLSDGSDHGGWRGESSVGTDARNPDSDGDGVLDGVETGVTAAVNAECPPLPGDLDTATTTSPTGADTDGDGIPDGAEDTNHNGRVDQGELDPLNQADGAGDPTTQTACAVQNLVPVDKHALAIPDLHVVTARRGPNGFTEMVDVLKPQGGGTAVVGMMGFHPAHGVAFLAIMRKPTGADALAEETRLRADLQAVSGVQTPITSRFTTWDQYDAVHATYQMAGGIGVKARANSIMQRLVPGTTTLLNVAGDVTASEALVVHAQVVRRSANTSVVLVALMAKEQFTGTQAFTLVDMTDGSSLAQYPDSLGTQCDRFESRGYDPVDILWAVDNSTSMNDEQEALAASAAAMNTLLSSSTMDWRAAMVTSAFYAPKGTTDNPPCTNAVCQGTLESQCRAFTRDLNVFSNWLLEGQTPWIGAGGHCNQSREEVIRGAQMMLSNTGGHARFMPPQAQADNMHLREGAHLVLIFMGDADDQYYENTQLPGGIDTFESFFRGLPVASLTMGAIICPGGECGETQRNPHVINTVVNRFGGVVGSLRDHASIAPTVQAILDRVVGNVSPYVLSKPAISSTLRVSMEPNSTVGTCNWTDVPRSRTDGFDYDSRNRTLLFFGNCRPNPATPGKRVAVSYRYWMDLSPEPDPQPVPCSICGTCPGVSRCDLSACACVCDQALTCGPGFRWNQEACDCQCSPADLGCPSTHQVDLDLCACVCKPDCGGCLEGMCQPSLCECAPMEG